MLRSINIILLCFVFSGLLAQNKNFNIKEFYKIDREHSRIEFSVKYMGYAKVKGRFERFQGTFRYDENDLSKTSVSLSIAVKSLDSDSDWRDKDLKSESWFDAEKHPTISFSSIEIVEKEGTFELIGELNIKGISKEVILKMDPPSGVLKDFRGDAQVIFTGTTQISRTDFGVEGESWSAIKEGITAVEDEVEIEFSILGKQIKAENYRNRLKDESKAEGKIYKRIKEKGVSEGLQLYETMKAEGKQKLNYRILNTVGQMLLKEGNVEEAIEVFEKNIEYFPKKSRTLESYAEGLIALGKLAEAKENYEKSLEKDPWNQNAKEMLKHLE